MAELEERKRQLNEQYVTATDPRTLDRLYDDLTAVAAELGEAEDRWTTLQAEVEAGA